MPLYFIGKPRFKFGQKLAARWEYNSKDCKLWRKQEGKCYYCDLPMKVYGFDDCEKDDPLNATREHLVKREWGGDNALDNLALAHHICNASRGDRSVQQHKIWIHEKIDFYLEDNAA